MTVPSVIGDLSTTASSNSPAGSDSPVDTDNFLRAHAAFIAQLNANKADKASPTFTGTVVLPSTTSIGNASSTEIGYLDGVTSAIQTQLDAKAPLASPTFTGTVTAAAVTTTGNTILGNASTDTLNVGNGGIVKDASGVTTFGGQVLPSATATHDLGSSTARWANGWATSFNASTYWVSDPGFANWILDGTSGFFTLSTSGTGNDRTVFSLYQATGQTVFDGNVISSVDEAAPTLSTNGQMVFNLTSNTNLRVSVRGSDGVTRTANIALA